ncbi:MAG: undecaprenyl-diphosphate phosphatase [Candidatus Saccharimonadales bacterium]
MSILIAVILGLIQGVTEFLPVSSSGHVLIFSRLLNNPSSFEFDVLVSFGTLLAVIIYYRKRFIEIILDILQRRDFSLTLKLLVATIPAVLVGFTLQDFISAHLHGTSTAIIMLLLIGILMILSANWKPDESLRVNLDLHKITYTQVLLIGLAQCVSLISGSSRSGVTMLMALKLGIKTKVAAEWSFLMSVPVIFGAALKVLVSAEGQKFIQTETAVFIFSNAISFVSGMVAIHILLKILAKKGLYWFGWYRIILALVLILLVSVKIL